MALNKAADAVPGRVHKSARPGMSGGTVAGRGEPANRYWGLGVTPT
jgi:hypothetical protein